MEFKSGFVAVVGLPNVGKSSFVNAMVKRKVSIVTPKPQTTRNKILAIYNEPNYQIMFVDTPGIHKARTSLDKYMDKSISSALVDVDVILLFVDGTKVIYEQIESLLKKYKNVDVPKFLVVNKIDKAELKDIVPQVDKFKEGNFQEIVFISATTRKNLDVLLNLIKPYLTDNIKYYDDETYSDKDNSFLISEIIREKALYLIQEEIPHGIGVKVDAINKEKEILKVSCTIYCEKNNHKAIIIGKNGAMIKLIGQKARLELEKILNTKIFLELWVKVKENWKDIPSTLQSIGYKETEI